MHDKIVEQSGKIVWNRRWRQSRSPMKCRDCLHDNDTNMPDGVMTVLGLPYDEKKIVANNRSTRIVLNMTQNVVDLHDLSRRPRLFQIFQDFPTNMSLINNNSSRLLQSWLIVARLLTVWPGLKAHSRFDKLSLDNHYSLSFAVW